MLSYFQPKDVENNEHSGCLVRQGLRICGPYLVNPWLQMTKQTNHLRSIAGRFNQGLGHCARPPVFTINLRATKRTDDCRRGSAATDLRGAIAVSAVMQSSFLECQRHFGGLEVVGQHECCRPSGTQTNMSGASGTRVSLSSAPRPMSRLVKQLHSLSDIRFGKWWPGNCGLSIRTVV